MNKTNINRVYLILLLLKFIWLNHATHLSTKVTAYYFDPLFVAEFSKLFLILSKGSIEVNGVTYRCRQSASHRSRAG